MAGRASQARRAMVGRAARHLEGVAMTVVALAGKVLARVAVHAARALQHRRDLAKYVRAVALLRARWCCGADRERRACRDAGGAAPEWPKNTAFPAPRC